MSDPITNYAAQLLRTSEHIVVPLEKLYQALVAEGWMSQIDFEMFESLLADDWRFELLEGLSDIETLRPALLVELEIQGLLEGPLVMLRERAFPPEVVMLDILNYLEAMNRSLETVWHEHSAQEMADEPEILNLLMMGDMLERELKQTLHLELFPENNLRENGEVDNL